MLRDAFPPRFVLTIIGHEREGQPNPEELQQECSYGPLNANTTWEATRALLIARMCIGSNHCPLD